MVGLGFPRTFHAIVISRSRFPEHYGVWLLPMFGYALQGGNNKTLVDQYIAEWIVHALGGGGG